MFIRISILNMFEIAYKTSSRGIEYKACYINLNFRGEVWAEDTHLGVIQYVEFF